MLSQDMEKALNKHLNEELSAAYHYLSTSAYFEQINLIGFASWMKAQATEELNHAMKFYNFIHDRGGAVTLTSVAAPRTEWESPLDAFEDSYNHECKVSKMIHNLVDLSLEEKDHPTNAFLQWFVTEQVEEEATAQGIVEKLKLVGDNKGGLFMLDKELGQRGPDSEE